MASSLNADNGVVSGSAGLKSTADTSGVLALQTNGTTALTINTDLSATFAGAVTASSFSGTTTTATNLAGGSNGTIPYQSASGTTQMLAAGTSGQVLTSGGVGAPTWTTPSTAGSANFTAASAITAGQTVQFTTGTSVEAVAGTVYTQSVAGNNTVYSGSTTTDVTGVAFDPNTAGSFVTFVWNSGLVITAGTLSNNTTTLGTPLTVATGGTTGNRFYTPKVMFDPVTPGKCMLVVQDQSGATPTIRAYIFTVSGTTITLASQTALLVQNYKCAFSYYAQDAFVYTYLQSTTLYAVACSISGSTITQGTATSIATSVLSNDGYSCIDLDYVRTSSNQLAAAFINSSNNDPSACVFTVTPATKAITAGSAVVVVGGVTASGVSIACDPFVSRIAVAYWHSSGVAIGGALLTAGTNVLGTNTTWVTLTSPYNTGSGGSRIAFATTADGENNKSVLVHFWTGNYIAACCTQFWSYYFRSGILTGSGTPTITWGAYSTVAADLTSGYIALGSFNQTNQAGKFPLVYKATSSSTIMKLGQATLTDTNFDSTKIIGIASTSASAAASVTVNVFGAINSNQTGLTPQSTYYVDQTGALTTSATAPNVSMGKALSATSILLKGLTV